MDGKKLLTHNDHFEFELLSNTADLAELSWGASKTFVERNPPTKFLKITAEEYYPIFHFLFTHAIKQKLTIIVRDKKNNKIVCAGLVLDAATEVDYPISMTAEKIIPLSRLLEAMDKKMAINAHQPGEIAHGKIFFMADGYRNLNLIEQRSILQYFFLAEQGYKKIVMEFTNPVSYQILNHILKKGRIFEHSIAYRDFVYQDAAGAERRPFDLDGEIIGCLYNIMLEPENAAWASTQVITKS